MGSAVIEEDQFDEWVITNNIDIATEEDVKKSQTGLQKIFNFKTKEKLLQILVENLLKNYQFIILNLLKIQID